MKNPKLNPYKHRIAKYLAKIWLNIAAAEEEIRLMEQDGYHDGALEFRKQLAALKLALAGHEEAVD